MKLDKETLVKHQFWFMLGGFALLWLAAVSSLKLLASGPIEAKRKAYETAAANIKSAQSKKPKNPETFLPPWQKNAKQFRDKRDEIWGAAFQLQNPKGEPFETWPQVGQMPLLRYPDDTNAAGLPLPSTEDRQEFMTKGYYDQYKGIEDLVAPTELAGGVAGIMAPQNWTKTPSREECWLAQEDLWVKRELLRVVKAANDSVARLHEEQPKAGEKRPEGVPASAKHRRFRNYNWQMDLFIGQVGDRQAILPASTVTNVHKAGRTLPLATKDAELSFNLWHGKAQPFTLIVRGEAAPPGASRYLKSKDGKPLTSDTIDFTSEGLQVEEVFVWETVPVKRIDAVRAPYQSHRTYTMTLKAKESLKKLDPDSAPAADASSTDPNATPGARPPARGWAACLACPGRPAARAG
jgi:hypothetical protein